MYNTGTLSPILNEKPYTENEKIVLNYFFTNTDKNIYCATNKMSSQLWSFLVGQYSRSHKSLRDRFLQLFEDAEKSYEKGKINRKDFFSIDELAEMIKKNTEVKIDFFEEKASKFLFKWGVQYGHNSLKDADNIRFAIEGVSQVATKILESPFPCLGNFQEKSTRYLAFNQESLLIPPELIGTLEGEELNDLYQEALSLYQESLTEVSEKLQETKIIDKEKFKTENSFQKTLEAKAFDIVRYLLPTGVSTSLGASFSTRTLESHLSFLLSHPLEEIRIIGQSMYEEAKKLSPGLLKHVKENNYLKDLRNDLSNYPLPEENKQEFHQGIDNKKRVKIIKSDDIDSIVASSLIYYNQREKGRSFYEIFNYCKNINNLEKENIIKKGLQKRSQFDRMPRELQHGTILVEFLCDFGAFRDLQRHRASTQLYLGASSLYGYDYPEYINLPEFKNFKEKYDELMLKFSNFYKEKNKTNPYLKEYFACMGHLVRTTFEMHPGQLAYVIELRTTPQGHYSYRLLFQELHKQIKKIAPIFSQFIKSNQNLEESRQKQEEIAEEKLGKKDFYK
jgi:thymidylate synthase ThyX